MNRPEHNPSELVTEILEKIARLNRQLPAADEPACLHGAPVSDPAFHGAPVSDPADSDSADWPGPAQEHPDRDFALRLQQQMLDMGILPAFARHVLEYLQTTERECQHESQVLPYLRALLRSWWRAVPVAAASSVQSHVFVGPAGAGKTTVLSKWLAQEVLLGGRSAHVWRLDGCTANTAEALTVYSEILGVPIARAWNKDFKTSDLQFFDLPGVDWRDAGAVAGLSQRIQELGMPQVHLVLNAAYDTPLLLHQARVFSRCSVSDLIFTHLDEETRWGKLWNLVAGTELPIRFLGAGQNVPGHFRQATPELLLPSASPWTAAA